MSTILTTVSLRSKALFGTYRTGLPTATWRNAGDVSETYLYTCDGIGNRLTAQEGASQFSYTSNLLNQYTAINSNQPTYDADGNMLTSGDGWIYAWNGENRQVRAEKDGTVVKIKYDMYGVRKQQTGKQQHYDMMKYVMQTELAK